MVQDDEPVELDAVRVVFDDDRVVSDAGIALVATLAGRLGIERLAGGSSPPPRSPRRVQRGPQGDGVDLRDGVGRRLDR